MDPKTIVLSDGRGESRENGGMALAEWRKKKEKDQGKGKIGEVMISDGGKRENTSPPGAKPYRPAKEGDNKPIEQV